MLALVRGLFWTVLLVGINGACAALIVVSGMFPNLPDLTRLENYKPRLPLQVYSSDGELLGEFGEEKRQLLSFDQYPPLLVGALLATEDQRYYEHYGVDIVGLMRAALSWLQGGRQGASTISMQVVRNFYLERTKTFVRKAYEVMMAYKIENSFSKRQILEFYMNQIYLGRGSYGFAAAAKAYYGKQVEALTLPEIAMLAGLPQAPSRLNPARNAKLAKQRQIHVLNRLLELRLISKEEHLEAKVAPLPKLVAAGASSGTVVAVAGYVAEEVRRDVYRQHGDRAYELGLRVHTTVASGSQRAAVRAVRWGLIEYTLRHPDSYGGPEAYEEIAGFDDKAVAALLADISPVAGLEPAIVTKVAAKEVTVVRSTGARLTVSGKGLSYIAPSLRKKKGAPPVSAGARVRIISLLGATKDDEPYWLIMQIPTVEGALVAMDPYDGRVLAMAGGFDFRRNQYNHVTQAQRQIGSAIKPFIYSAALEKGFTAATLIDDAPVFLTAEQTGSGKPWQPRNYDGKFKGPIPLRQALAKSRNLPTIRVLDAISPDYARDYILRFGFKRDTLPPFLTMALGAGEVTPLQMAASYASFTNGGYLLKPSLIERIEDAQGNLLYVRRDDSERVRIIDQRNAFMIADLLKSVVSYGTGERVKWEIKRSDLAGKTGTTNDYRDAWFAGFTPELVAVTWVGFDTPRSLGPKETGSRAALPLWINFMTEQLQGREESELLMPPGIVRVAINPASGLLAQEGDPDARWEIFYEENVPSSAGESERRYQAEEELL